MTSKNKKNPHGGAKHKRFKKGGTENTGLITRSTILEDAQYYALVEKSMGDYRFSVKVLSENSDSFKFNGSSILARLSGKMRKKRADNIVKNNDFVLISLRISMTGSESEKADILLKYSDADISRLILMNEIPSTKQLNNLLRNDKKSCLNDIEFIDDDEYRQFLEESSPKKTNNVLKVINSIANNYNPNDDDNMLKINSNDMINSNDKVNGNTLFDCLMEIE